MIERLILTGLINSTAYLQQIRSSWDTQLLGSRSAQYIANWCIDFFDKYAQAPENTIADIYYDEKESGGIPKGLDEDLGDLLEDLAEEFGESFNIQYALDQTNKHFSKRHLEIHQEKVRDLSERGLDTEAQDLASSYLPFSFDFSDDLDLSDRRALPRVKSAFMGSFDPLISYPGQLGRLWNDQLVRGGFVSLLASEKRGKSFWLLDMAIRATRNKYKVAFFQAGDMTEDQQLKRIGSYLTKLPLDEKSVGTMYMPVADCLKNQLDLCDLEERQCGFGIFTGGEFYAENIRKEITREQLVEAGLDYGRDYSPCTNCENFKRDRLGVPWLVPKEITHVLTPDEAVNKVREFFVKKKRRFMISTHPNNTLSVGTIRSTLDRWEQVKGFVPDVVVIDYADLLVAVSTKEFRHAQNEIWKDLRALSQQRHCLVLTATQADAKSYDQSLLKLSNFSEDKRKFAHVTAMFGLNQDRDSREKKLGIMRVNALLKRSGEFDSTHTVTVLQNLNLGQPYLDSYV